MSKERPILFNAEMVRAVLAGKKTQTRRVMKSQPPKGHIGCQSGEDFFFAKANPIGDSHYLTDHSDDFQSPYGKIGDRLWVRETHAFHDEQDKREQDLSMIYYRADDETVYESDLNWTPSIFMPRVASRILLEITNVRIERLQEISEQDAMNEGISFNIKGAPDDYPEIAPSDVFKELWDSINGKSEGKTWVDNPWVWVVEFKIIEVKGASEQAHSEF